MSSKNETSTPSAEAEIVLSHVISFPIIKISWQVATRWIWVPQISQIQQNIWLKRRLNPFFYKLPSSTNKYAAMRIGNIWLWHPFGVGSRVVKALGFLRFAKTLTNADLLLLGSGALGTGSKALGSDLIVDPPRLGRISILYWKISISRPTSRACGLTF